MTDTTHVRVPGGSSEPQAPRDFLQQYFYEMAGGYEVRVLLHCVGEGQDYNALRQHYTTGVRFPDPIYFGLFEDFNPSTHREVPYEMREALTTALALIEDEKGVTIFARDLKNIGPPEKCFLTVKSFPERDVFKLSNMVKFGGSAAMGFPVHFAFVGKPERLEELLGHPPQ